ncbi:1-deoxy-D-xylulose-5-phosphate synthase [Streptomyces sp. NP160]|uniref:1-deoxy-D-xylulose-5-phosphate synthase n=1 Tax=Streptomyces sp. NP160 TaxID=2586637 RepID=UPI001119F077|nr:1-deoxy-D-xylulose-5-phosphate synthase [Streptomyces sp. NP160]TNM68917.1 1-deoxy-D-xylulose-5-phosphate synthase [Streptomyces sp. NP160]
MGLLPQITSPRDLRRLTTAQVCELADELRTFLVREVSRTGGHLGPNLGVVELTLAIHRTFDSPRDAVVFDTGHQSYVHKLLTGRQDFSGLRKRGGLAGYPSREESVHDVVENSHASTSLSWAHGIAQGFALQGQGDRHVVAVIGDGALTGGMAWEALNNIAADADRRMVVVVNDNGRSYAPTIGGMAHHLATLRTTRGYERFLEWGKATLARGGAPGRMAYDTLHGMKKGLKDFVAPQGLFEDLGMKYIGPVDGHDVEALEHALGRAKAFGGPVIVHAMTRKGNGFSAAETDEADRFHAVGVIDPDTGQSLAPSGAAPTWTKVFAEEMVEVGRRRADVVGITAAMLIPVGLHRFAAEHPDRVIDVGIAEQHATTAAAGLAFTGLHPVVAVYSTFLNRAFDQVLLDVALHRAGVTFVLDRAGITGDDGPSHHGIWDMSLLAPVPGLRLAAPRDAATLREELAEALDVDDAPTVLRFSKGAAPESVPALERLGGPHGVDVLARTGTPGERTERGQRDVLVVAVGAFAPLALEVAERLAAHGISATVVDPRWVLPVSPLVVDLARHHRLVLTVEDGVRTGGVGSCTAQALADAGVDVPTSAVGVPVRFWEHGSRAQVLAAAGLTAQDIARGVAERVSGLADGSTGPSGSVGRVDPGAPLAERG